MSFLKFQILLFSFFLFFLTSIGSYSSNFLLGIDVYLRGYTHLTKGHRVGLITNQTGINAKGKSTIDLLFQHPDVNLVSLFAPEHGIRGAIQAGKNVSDTKDPKTGLQIYSLYNGSKHRPSKKALDSIDTLIYDIQDVGSRAYTYIWSMAEAMAAAGENSKTFIILDRPNPMGCEQLDGPITEKKWLSFVGLYPIPRVYGMTVGELARYLNLYHKLGCKLIVIPMASYHRKMTWAETKLPWIPPSPNIPSIESAQCFAATGTIGELGIMNIGIGTPYSFQIVGAPWLDSIHAEKYLNNLGLPGVLFKRYSIHPNKGIHKNKRVNAILLEVTDINRFLPSTTEIHILYYCERFYKKHFKWLPKKIKSFDNAIGSNKIREALIQGADAQQITKQWTASLADFKRKIRPIFIYD